MWGGRCRCGEVGGGVVRGVWYCGCGEVCGEVSGCMGVWEGGVSGCGELGVGVMWEGVEDGFRLWSM